MVPQILSSDCFILPPEFRAEIIDHARAGYPEEVCGVIAGMPGVATALHPGSNVSPTRQTAYELDVETLARQISFEDAGLTLAAIYHSHPHGPEEPSRTDIRLAYYPDSLYIICSLTDQKQAVVRGFRIVDGQVREVMLIP
jgi:proteasome lid subunit RPN8/RPN11